jgi:methylthioribose-1-phosphate isomerase
MKVRGAPAIGVAAAYGIALGAQNIKAETKAKFLSQFHKILQAFAAARPTAVNLFRAIDRMKKAAETTGDVPQIKQALIDEARKIHAEEETATRRLSQLGAKLLKDGFTILTHCNAGALATAGYGTALGVIKAASEQGKKIEVIATETRPLLQGARLTTWELMQENIPVTLITDSMAGYFLSRGKVNCVIVGADRIAANGDTANKIGTYTLAVLAKENGIPFYVAAPTSTIDLSLKSGAEIPIEERNPEEVTSINGVRLAPKGVKAANPAFDVTPNKYITAIITEKGIIRKPYNRGLQKLVGK